MLLGEHLVQGVDVWLNTPRRPWEASGTSGMKVLVNGGLNLSELDGWWVEAYTPEVGWALGDGWEHGDDPAWDAAEAEALYNILEQQLIPEFYSRNGQGIPERWVQRMRKSMSTLTPQFSANRTVREYTEKYYLPAAANYLQRAADKGAAGSRIVRAHHELQAKWSGMKFSQLQSAKTDDGWQFHISINLNGVDPKKITVELYADVENDQPEKIVMQLDSATNRPGSDYTVRVIPGYENISLPLEDYAHSLATIRGIDKCRILLFKAGTTHEKNTAIPAAATATAGTAHALFGIQEISFPYGPYRWRDRRAYRLGNG